MSQAEQSTINPLLQEYKNNTPFATYGYTHDMDTPSLMTVDETTAPHVRYIFQRFLEGESFAQIAAGLMDMGAPTPTMHRKALGINQVRVNYRWHPSTITGILQNRAYVGDYIYHIPRVSKGLEDAAHTQAPFESGTVIHNHHEPLVTQEDFDRTTAILQNRSRQAHSGESVPRKNLTPFASSLFCGICGYPLTGGSFKPYVCSNRHCTTKDMCPPAKHPVKELTASVTSAILAEREQARHISQLLADRYEGDEYRKAEAAIKGKILLVLDDALRTGESPESCTRQLVALQGEKNHLLDTFTKPSEWQTLFQDIPDDFEFDRELSKKLVQRIDVYPDKSTRISFRSDKEKTALMDYLRELHVID